ncbi:hypothetical protein [Bordetella sp. N]|uniref:hypothetical protein n=1 Tax=Bordetella sp. N TaxID=1746199 RepID=UPI0007110A87|nr:hypothetical protein [Bordetella sp. N]ALM83392.1 hypothetical protein ASB57_10805 [Bordetella sp. N]
MAWIPLHALLDGASLNRGVAYGPDMDRVTLAGDSLALAGGLQGLGARRVGLWFDDAASLAVALLACWRVGATAVLAPDNRAATRNALAEQAEGLDLWLTDGGVAGAAAPLPGRGRSRARQRRRQGWRANTRRCGCGGRRRWRSTPAHSYD